MDTLKLMIAKIFLGLNGWGLNRCPSPASDAGVVTAMRAMGAGEMAGGASTVWTQSDAGIAV